MKKTFVLLLVSFLLCGCTVSISTSVVSGNSREPTEPIDPESVELISIDSWGEDTGLVLNVNIDKNPAFKKSKDEVGTQFEMVLNMFHCVLEIRPLEKKAEALLSGTDFTGVFYQTAMADILALAQKQQLLESSTIITVSATEVDQDSWTHASYNILERPIENYRQDCGIFFSYKLNAAGEYFDEKDYTAEETDDTRIFEDMLYDGTPYIGYSRVKGASLVTEMTIMTRLDGSIEEQYLPTPEECVICAYHSDGSFSFSAAYGEGFDTHYTIYPDCTIESNSRFHIDGITVSEKFTDRDGNIAEHYYKDGVQIKGITKRPDGSVSVSCWSEDRSSLTENWTYANGDTSEFVFEFSQDGSVNGRFERHCYADGRVEEFYYDREGNLIPTPSK